MTKQNNSYKEIREWYNKTIEEVAKVFSSLKNNQTTDSKQVDIQQDAYEAVKSIIITALGTRYKIEKHRFEDDKRLDEALELVIKDIEKEIEQIKDLGKLTQTLQRNTNIFFEILPKIIQEFLHRVAVALRKDKPTIADKVEEAARIVEDIAIEKKIGTERLNEEDRRTLNNIKDKVSHPKPENYVRGNSQTKTRVVTR